MQFPFTSKARTTLEPTLGAMIESLGRFRECKKET